VSWSRSNPATRDQSPIYAVGAYCVWRPPIRSSALERARSTRSSSSWRARSARFSCPSVSVGSGNGSSARLPRARDTGGQSPRGRPGVERPLGRRIDHDLPADGRRCAVMRDSSLVACPGLGPESRCRSSVIRCEPGDGLWPARCTGGPAPSFPHALQIGRDTPRSPSSASPSPHRPHGRPSPAAGSGSGESLIFQRFIPRQTHPHANPCLLECFNRDTRAQRDVEHDLAGIEEHGQGTRGCQALTFRRPR
jgi:hypothetical protein